MAKKRTDWQTIFNDFQRRILNGEYAPYSDKPFPTNRQIRKELGAFDSTIQRVINTLYRCGLLTKSGKKRLARIKPDPLIVREKKGLLASPPDPILSSKILHRRNLPYEVANKMKGPILFIETQKKLTKSGIDHIISHSTNYIAGIADLDKFQYLLYNEQLDLISCFAHFNIQVHRISERLTSSIAEPHLYAKFKLAKESNLPIVHVEQTMYGSRDQIIFKSYGNYVADTVEFHYEHPVG